MSITDFLNARIAEDEAVARAAIATDEPDEWENPTQTQNHWPANIAFWDRVTPARILAECDTKRAIVELAEAANQSDAELDYQAGKMQPIEPLTGDSILYALAAVYADHPDYQDEWRVGA